MRCVRVDRNDDPAAAVATQRDDLPNMRLTAESLGNVRCSVTERAAKVDGVRRATPMLVVLICIELSDVLFAVDSIPAVVGITQVRSRTHYARLTTHCVMPL